VHQIAVDDGLAQSSSSISFRAFCNRRGAETCQHHYSINKACDVPCFQCGSLDLKKSRKLVFFAKFDENECIGELWLTRYYISMNMT